MTLSGKRTYVGFGFGAIQAGLFLYEAFQSRAFRRLVVVGNRPEVIGSVRRAGGFFSVNIAYSDRIEPVTVGPVEIEDPASEQDRARVIDAIAEAEEIGTAIPSVELYATHKPGSLNKILAVGLRRKLASNGPQAVVYTAENHNHATEILQAKVLEEIPANERQVVLSRCQFLNTVIGKMSGIASAHEDLRGQTLAPITLGDNRAFLVEAFNRILISKIRFDDTAGHGSFTPGIAIFEEKEDLLPFEEAKLYSHNAIHALAAYIGAVGGVRYIADVPEIPGALSFLRAAFIEESGKALIKKYSGLDPLFTSEGFREYADDLLLRMMNPNLRDTVERVGRDPERKLGWDDRLIGTMRLVLREGIEPRRFAFGVAAALWLLDQSTLQANTPVARWLDPFWTKSSPQLREREIVLKLIEDGRDCLKKWCGSGSQNLEALL